MRRHAAALIPLAGLALPQVWLGAESQLLAFAAAQEGGERELFFAPFPEMFPDAASLRAALRRLGGAAAAPGGGRLVHLRFGSARSARVIKGVRNGCVIAEAECPPPLTASHHPFASGTVLPAAVARAWSYGGIVPRLRTAAGNPVPVSRLPPSCLDADLRLARKAAKAGGAVGEGLELVALSDFRSAAWAAGPVRGRGPLLQPADLPKGTILLPWNMDHAGSIVPLLLERLARLHGAAARPGGAGALAIVLLPFNYIGQTGIIRRLIGRLREAAHEPGFLQTVFLGRVGHLAGVAALRRRARCAWVDGNDPEHWWTLHRLAASGVPAVLIDAGSEAAGWQGARVQADEAIWVEAETRCGVLTFPARLPSWRRLPALLALSARRPSRNRLPPAAAAAAERTQPAAGPVHA